MSGVLGVEEMGVILQVRLTEAMMLCFSLRHSQASVIMRYLKHLISRDN